MKINLHQKEGNDRMNLALGLFYKVDKKKDKIFQVALTKFDCIYIYIYITHSRNHIYKKCIKFIL